MSKTDNSFSKTISLETRNWCSLLPFFKFDYITLRFRNQTQAEGFLELFEKEFQKQYARKLRRITKWAKFRYVHGRPSRCKIEVAVVHFETKKNHSSQLQFIGPVANLVFQYLVQYCGESHVLNIQSISRFDVRLDSHYLFKQANQLSLWDFYNHQNKREVKWKYNSVVDCVQNQETNQVTIYIGERLHPKTTVLKRFYIGREKSIYDTEINLSPHKTPVFEIQFFHGGNLPLTKALIKDYDYQKFNFLLLDAFHREIDEFAFCAFTKPIYEFRNETQRLLLELKQLCKPNKKESKKLQTKPKVEKKKLFQIKKSTFLFWFQPTLEHKSEDQWLLFNIILNLCLQHKLYQTENSNLEKFSIEKRENDDVQFQVPVNVILDFMKIEKRASNRKLIFSKVFNLSQKHPKFLREVRLISGENQCSIIHFCVSNFSFSKFCQCSVPVSKKLVQVLFTVAKKEFTKKQPRFLSKFVLNFLQIQALNQAEPNLVPLGNLLTLPKNPRFRKKRLEFFCVFFKDLVKVGTIHLYNKQQQLLQAEGINATNIDTSFMIVLNRKVSSTNLQEKEFDVISNTFEVSSDAFAVLGDAI